jgi:drug/metabolite transporter (DMT)-like permease
VLAQFFALAVTWGASFLFIKVGLEGLSPSQVVLGRLVAGGVALVVFTIATRQALPREAVVWGHLAVVSVLLCVVPFSLFAWAEQHISSGLASIYNATTPLMTMLVALVALPQERPTLTRLAGLLAGFLGVLVVLAPWRGLEGGAALAQAGCLLATACYGISFVYLRRFVAPRGLPAVPLATVQVGLGAVLMLLGRALGRRPAGTAHRPGHAQRPGPGCRRDRPSVRVEHQRRGGMGRDERLHGHLPHAPGGRRARGAHPQRARQLEPATRSFRRRAGNHHQPGTSAGQELARR